MTTSTVDPLRAFPIRPVSLPPFVADRQALGIFSVMDFGAKGDAVTDDTAAIQTAINAAQAVGGAGGAIVYFPVGQYKTSAPLVVSASGIVLQGAGRLSSTIFSTVNGQDILHLTGTAPAPIAYGAVRDLQFSSSNVNAGHCIFATYCQVWIYEDLQLQSAGGDGIHLDSNCYLTGISNCRAHNLGGAAFFLGVDSNAVRLVGCEANLCKYGVQIGIAGNNGSLSFGIAIIGGSCEGCSSGQIAIYYARAVEITGVDLEQGNGVIIGDPASAATAVYGVSVSSCNFEDTNAGTVITVQRALGVSIKGNLFSWTTGDTATPITVATTASGVVIESNAYQTAQTVVNNAGLACKRVNDGFSAATQGWGAATPARPAGTGAANAVQNTNPYPVRIYKAGASGTHIIDPGGNTVALPADPTEFILDPGAEVWYQTTVATAWNWYGCNG